MKYVCIEYNALYSSDCMLSVQYIYRVCLHIILSLSPTNEGSIILLMQKSMIGHASVIFDANFYEQRYCCGSFSGVNCFSLNKYVNEMVAKHVFW